LHPSTTELLVRVTVPYGQQDGGVPESEAFFSFKLKNLGKYSLKMFLIINIYFIHVLPNDKRGSLLINAIYRALRITSSSASTNIN
jgi:hypothetical protein